MFVTGVKAMNQCQKGGNSSANTGQFEGTNIFGRVFLKHIGGVETNRLFQHKGYIGRSGTATHFRICTKGEPGMRRSGWRTERSTAKRSSARSGCAYLANRLLNRALHRRRPTCAWMERDGGARPRVGREWRSYAVDQQPEHT